MLELGRTFSALSSCVPQFLRLLEPEREARSSLALNSLSLLAALGRCSNPVQERIEEKECRKWVSSEPEGGLQVELQSRP